MFPDLRCKSTSFCEEGDNKFPILEPDPISQTSSSDNKDNLLLAFKPEGIHCLSRSHQNPAEDSNNDDGNYEVVLGVNCD